ncbi:MAG: sugar phosphate isomerase/epimerase [Melioribacteraceae bacterium]|nr:sugar phosphate isomerase/epimerase [Melioribacteraceae bacterium]
MINHFKHKYGFNVFNLQPEDLFEYASSKGLKHIEINLSKEHLSLETFTQARIEELKSLSRIHKVQMSFHIPYYINISEILIPVRRKNIEYVKNCINIASELIVTHITIHVGNFYWFPVEHWNRKKALQRFVKSLKDILKLCEEKKIIIALENVVPIPNGSEYYLLGDNAEDFNYVFSQIDSNWLKFCLDTGHANMGEGVVHYANCLNKKLCSIHYHDNNGKDDEHLAVGLGTVPWQDLADELENLNYQGPIVSECRDIEAHKAAELLNDYFSK